MLLLECIKLKCIKSTTNMLNSSIHITIIMEYLKHHWFFLSRSKYYLETNTRIFLIKCLFIFVSQWLCVPPCATSRWLTVRAVALQRKCWQEHRQRCLVTLLRLFCKLNRYPSITNIGFPTLDWVYWHIG